MFSYFGTAVLGVVVLWLSNKIRSIVRNVAIAKVAGIPYRISPISGIAGFFWTAIHDVILNTIKLIPGSEDWVWPMLLEPHRSWHHAEKLREKLGDTYMIVSPAQVHLISYNAEVIGQISARRNDFPKPVEIYEIVDMFGKSVMTTEEWEWRRHRKIVGSAFSEKSNALVWKESLKQGEGMLKFWSRLAGNKVGCIKVEDTIVETTLMALYVVSAAGFGIRQVWEGEGEEQLGSKIVPGFNTSKLFAHHTLPFKDAINHLVHSIIWFALMPVWLLRLSPLDVHKKLVICFDECSNYFKELAEYKTKQFENGDKVDDGTMDVMGPLVKASEVEPELSNGVYLTKQEVIANAWILLFAGHETSGSITHYSLLFLAIEQAVQAKVQTDIDSIVGSRLPETWTYDTDLGNLYQSMVGAVINETLRLLPPIIDIPKITREKSQTIKYNDRTITVPPNTMIQLSAVGVQRNSQYWPHTSSKISNKAHDLDDWVPQRWLNADPSEKKEVKDEWDEAPDVASFDQKTSKLFTPSKGSFIPFAEGGRSCPGKRFAQIEITAVLSVIFKTYSVELDVSRWASDEEVGRMNFSERIAIYQKAMVEARRMIFGSETIVFLQMQEKCPVRFVQRGAERFRDL
ncbi:cytochrome P450 monooxygenase-like protein [Tricladium varicosporioides]|nr:cytochrome P450 monooxygenase-like protein [Hymenoscyphus varicosporioides]